MLCHICASITVLNTNVDMSYISLHVVLQFHSKCVIYSVDNLFLLLREIIVQLGYNSGHIVNPFSPLLSPHRSEYPAPFHLMWQRINNQKILDPLCLVDHVR